MKKYEFTGEVKMHFGVTLHQIRALVTIGSVIAAGTIGGWVEKEENLSHDDNAWVHGNAQVYGNARVHGNAQVYGNARVHGDAWVSGDAWVHGNATKTPIAISGLQWCVTIIDAHIQIGCQFHKTEDWRKFNAEEISDMHSDAESFWKTYKSTIMLLADNHQK